MIMGQIGEYRELSHEERQEYLMGLLESGTNETRTIQKAGLKAIREMFAEALGCLEDAACHLRDIGKQYLELYPDDECEEPEVIFWWGIEEAIKPLEQIQEKLEAVADCVPKEVTA